MFTLKFMLDGSTVVVAAARYDIDNKWGEDKQAPPVGAIVSVYQQPHTGEGGVDFAVGKIRGGYMVCYVENEAGKTIDRIGPFGD